MTERLQRIHALLRAGNVPCELASRPGLGTVLQAGGTETGQWDVVLRDDGRELWLHDSRGAVRLPDGSPDARIGDAVKFQVVRAWADQGNPDARALLGRLDRQAWSPSGFDAQRDRTQPASFIATAQLLDPLQFAEQMFDVANWFGSLLLTPPPGSTALRMWSPWGTVQFGYTRR
jgi:hypothetical protein